MVIPRIGFGAFMLKYNECYGLVTQALDSGYRHIDTAAVYGNEDICGKAIVDWCEKNNVKRTDIFLTSKLANCSDYYSTRAAIRSSLHHLGTYIDLFLIQSPAGGKKSRIASWKAMEEFVDSGDIRSVGVSNYGVKHLQELYASNPKFYPCVNQIELHPFLSQDDIVKYCQSHDIAIEAYSPLTHGIRLNDEKLVPIAKKLNISVAQLLIRWSLQKGYIPIIKSTKKEHMLSDLDVFNFTIPDDVVQELSSFDEHWHAGTTYDPTVCD